MRRWFQGLLVLGLAALPGSAQAQYAAPRYYYPQSYYPQSYYPQSYNPAWSNGYGGGAYYGYPQYYGYSSGWGQPTYNYASSPAYMNYTNMSSGPAMMNVPRADPLLPPASPALPDRAQAQVTPTSVGDGSGFFGRRLKSNPEPVATPEGSDTPTALPLLASPMPADPKAPVATPAPAPATVVAPPPASACGGPGCGLDCTICKPAKSACVEVFGDYLYWNVHNADVPFAQAFDGIDPANSVPRGAVGVASPRWASGYRAGAGVALNEDSWIVGTYTYFRDTTSASLAAPDTDVLHSFMFFPNTQNSQVDSLTASANYVIQLQTADIDYKCAFVNNDHLVLSWLAGARYGHLEQSFLLTTEIFGTTTVNSNITFDGGGPRAGLDGQYRIGHGFYGYGQGVVNLLAGRFDASYEERNIFTGLVGHTSIDSSRIVPVTELELGAGWQSHKGHVLVSGGYYVGAWFNTVTTNGLAQSINATNFTTNSNNFRDTLIFDGLVGRVEFRY